MAKLIFLSTVASPHQVRFVPYLRKYFDAEFYFYDQLGGRPDFWRVDLGEHCHLIPNSKCFHGKYFSWSVLDILKRTDPDIVMLGGFSTPGSILGYLWACLHGKKTVVQTERSRVMNTGAIRGYTLIWRMLHWIYRKVDLVMAVSPDIVPQFRDTMRFGSAVKFAPYPSDIDHYYKHPIRQKKEAYTLIYPNRMTDIYNPLAAVRVFAKVHSCYPKTKLKMNAAGELRKDVEALIGELKVGSSVDFLDNIKRWDDLSEVYATCDIMYLPAKSSNGNYTICECAISGMQCFVSDRVLGEYAVGIGKVQPGSILPLDEDLFADKICEAIEHPERYAEYTRRSRELFFPRTMEATAKLYDEVLGGIL